MNTSLYESYLSPFSWRYASVQMRKTWGEENKRLLWRQLWVYLAKTQCEFGLVSDEQVNELIQHMNDIDISRSLEIEKQTQHDLVAEIHTYAEQCPNAAKIIHLGATSMDIKDNAEMMQISQAMDILLGVLKDVLYELVKIIEKYADVPCIAFTHLQPAEPTTLGYRFSNYAQDLLMDWQNIKNLRQTMHTKGFKGAVGTASSYAELFNEEQFQQFEARLSELIGIPFFPVSTQTYTRKQDYFILSALAGLGASLYKFAFDLRLLQSQPFGEIQEPFGKHQVGSSAMPFKRNPIKSEKINSLARSLSRMPQTAWDNAAHSLLERTLDDSANRRTILPEAFLCCDEILSTTLDIFKNLVVNHRVIERNLSTYAPFSNTEKLMMTLVKSGANRQEIHARLRDHSLSAWKMVEEGQQHDLIDRLKRDELFLQYISGKDIEAIMNSQEYLGIAPQQAKSFAKKILFELN